MQSKISSFFKPSSSTLASSPNAKVTADRDNELTVGEKPQHQVFNTYTRRSSNPNQGGEGSDGEETGEPERGKSSKPILKDGSLRPELRSSSGKVLNKKRSYAQLHLDLGQSDFNLRPCSTCGMHYSPGDELDEKEHKTFHKSYTHGIPFKAWKNERLVDLPCNEGGRVVLVLDGDPAPQRNKVQAVVKMMETELGEGWIFHKLCKVYLYISSQRVSGCLVAESIKEAFRILPSSVDERIEGSKRKNNTRSNSTVLQFGGIKFHREVSRKAPSADSFESLNGNYNGAIICEENALPAVCGIRAIWVTPSHRRKHIASQLLEAVRGSFCAGSALEKSQMAFSAPTSAGKGLASNYFGTSSFLAYKTSAPDV